jgi:hypothetical protein
LWIGESTDKKKHTPKKQKNHQNDQNSLNTPPITPIFAPLPPPEAALHSLLTYFAPPKLSVVAPAECVHGTVEKSAQKKHTQKIKNHQNDRNSLNTPPMATILAPLPPPEAALHSLLTYLAPSKLSVVAPAKCVHGTVGAQGGRVVEAAGDGDDKGVDGDTGGFKVGFEGVL